MSNGQVPKHRVAYRIYEQAACELQRIEHPIRRQVVRQLKDSLQDHTHGWSQVRNHTISRIAVAIYTGETGNDER